MIKEYFVLMNVRTERYICFDDSDQFQNEEPMHSRGLICEDNDISLASEFSSADECKYELDNVSYFASRSFVPKLVRVTYEIVG